MGDWQCQGPSLLLLCFSAMPRLLSLHACPGKLATSLFQAVGWRKEEQLCCRPWRTCFRSSCHFPCCPIGWIWSCGPSRLQDNLGNIVMFSAVMIQACCDRRGDLQGRWLLGGHIFSTVPYFLYSDALASGAVVLERMPFLEMANSLRWQTSVLGAPFGYRSTNPEPTPPTISFIRLAHTKPTATLWIVPGPGIR